MPSITCKTANSSTVLLRKEDGNLLQVALLGDLLQPVKLEKRDKAECEGLVAISRFFPLPE